MKTSKSISTSVEQNQHNGEGPRETQAGAETTNPKKKMTRSKTISASTEQQESEEAPAATGASSVPSTTAIVENPEARQDHRSLPQEAGENREKTPNRISHSFGRAIKEVPTEELKYHPLSGRIYTQTYGKSLVQSIINHGILQPVLVAKSTMEVIAGNSRVAVARVLGLPRVPVTYYESEDPLEIRQAVLESNNQRVKTTIEKLREYTEWHKIESELGKQRMSGKTPGAKGGVAGDTGGKARDKAAQKIGMSGVNAEKGVAVVAVIDRLALTTGKLEVAQSLTKLLNTGSINAAHNRAVELGHIARKTPAAKTAPKSKLKNKGTAGSDTNSPIAQQEGHLDGAPPTSGSAVSEAPVASHDEAFGLVNRIVGFLRGQVDNPQNEGRSAEWRESLMVLTQCLAALGIEAA